MNATRSVVRLGWVLALVACSKTDRTPGPSASASAAIAPSASASSSAPPSADARAESAVRAAEDLAALHDRSPCPSLSDEVARFRTEHPALAADDVTFSRIDESPPLRARMRAAMDRVMAKSMQCSARDGGAVD